MGIAAVTNIVPCWYEMYMCYTLCEKCDFTLLFFTHLSTTCNLNRFKRVNLMVL